MKPQTTTRAELIDALRTASELESRIFKLGIIEQWWNLTQGTRGNRPIDPRAAQLAPQLSGWNVDMNGAITRQPLRSRRALSLEHLLLDGRMGRRRDVRLTSAAPGRFL